MSTIDKDLEKFVRHGLSLEYPLAKQTDYITHNSNFFVCNSGTTPVIDKQHYSLRIWGDAVQQEISLSYDELAKLPQRTVPALIECAGNHRSFFNDVDGKAIETPPGTEELIWSTGAIGMAVWEGVALSDVLKLAGVDDTAFHVCPQGSETDSCEGDVRIPMPIEKAMDKDTLLALRMNGEVLPADHGFPVRVLVPGWIGAYSVKWVNDIEVSSSPIWVRRNTTSYVLKGYEWPASEYEPSMGKPLSKQNIKSALALPYPATLTADTHHLFGFARSPGSPIAQVLWSDDNARTWREATLSGDNEPYGWVKFSFDWNACVGQQHIITKAIDVSGNSQPEKVPFNAAGYLYNAIYPHPITVE